ncbi:hypothetical protein L2Y96_09980 [Luteibacter aegosomaticola]|uniref:hypothetical protein n=1 Tax=Luteibacter aegosomaticola TaxID=2911538 RepID=UPI001FF92216|nr:hypothetical protein [Luteibacter aegosomaticola]UPG92069.1 hypothetical protein L2Y96_09980 [Luteibacter aegosomaticola]
MPNPTNQRERSATNMADADSNASVMLREIRVEDTIIDYLRPTIPAALPDGRVPLSSLDPHLIVRAPIVDTPGYITEVGDLFQAVLNDVRLDETTVTYKNEEEAFVELKIPKATLDSIEDGIHALAFRTVPRPFGDVVLSGRTRLVLDRVPPGGRYLPRIVFHESLEIDGLALTTLLSLPDATLVGIIPDYADVDPLDTIHVFIQRRGTDLAIPAGTVAAATDGRPMTVGLSRAILEKIDSPGRVDFFYRVVDALGSTSDFSTATALNISILSSPEILPAPEVVAAEDGLITDAYARPELVVRIPQLEPSAREGDTIQLFIGQKVFAPINIYASDIGDGPLKTVSVDYTTTRGLAEAAASVTFQEEIRYVHRRENVPSKSDSGTYAFDLTLPGGWDPLPETDANEALAKPVLRGATGLLDNVIGFDDSTLPATVYIGEPSSDSRASHTIIAGDKITVKLDDNAVGPTHVVHDGSYPIAVAISAADLNANAGVKQLSYDVERELQTKPHVAVARSVTQTVRIDSAENLPGSGKPLQAAVFLKARIRESTNGTYGLYAQDFTDGITQLRVFGYTNMKPGDRVSVMYEGFDRFDDGERVPGADGELSHVVTDRDVVPKTTPDPETGQVVYFDVDFPIEPAKAVAHGRIEYTHKATNETGTGASPRTGVGIRVRFLTKNI